MARNASKATPKVISGILYTDDAATGTIVGSWGWFAWLGTGATFYYAGRAGTFTARPGRQYRAVYWFAYRRIEGKLRKMYLGKPEALTVDRLEKVAGALNTK